MVIVPVSEVHIVICTIKENTKLLLVSILNFSICLISTQLIQTDIFQFSFFSTNGTVVKLAHTALGFKIKS